MTLIASHARTARLFAALLFFAFFGTLAVFGTGTIAEGAQPRYFPPFVPTDPIMPIAQVKPGMRGECRTVIRGTNIVTFPVEVLDVIARAGRPRNLILIRAGGKVIDSTGGIAAGMSGSPVYIGGRLVGAIGYGWNFSRHDMGLVTPIEDMMAIWDNPEIIPSFDPAPLIPDEPPQPRNEEVFPSPASSDETLADGYAASFDLMLERMAERQKSADLTDFGDAVSDDRSSPIYVHGLSERMAGRVGEILDKEVIPFGAGMIAGPRDGDRSKRTRYGAVLKPGMAVGTALVWGDVEISAIGTLTAVAEDGRFVAFAHPFMGIGTTSAALMDASIAQVIPGVSSPFKLGKTGDIIGIVTQDRPEGIGGRIGQFAPAASCTINLKDVDADRTYQRRFQMVQDKFQIATLASTAIVGCIEDLWGRRGGGLAKITATFAGANMPEGWKRTNVFVSEKDITTDMLQEFNLLTQLFAVNQFQELRPFGIDVTVEMTQEPRVIYVENVEVPQGPFHPGDRVSFDITLRPWRKAPFVRSYSLVIPKNVTGICELLVRGGGIAEESAESLDAGWRSISSLPILLNELDAKETNDQMILEIRGQEALEAQIQRARQGNPEDLMNDKLKSEIRAEKMKEGSMRVVRTNYYVDGLIHKLIRVEPAGPGTPEEATQ